MDACASSPASSSQAPCAKYDVFISFRGPDVRSGFLSHLEKELRQKNIEFFVDDRLESGDEISSALVKAIEESIIALVIFSKDYASSKWCLEELVKIMERKEANQQIVIPVFYHINPSDVRHQEGTYEDAFTHHEKIFKDEVKNWRSVLKNSANLSGHTSSRFKPEAKLVEEIVQDVLKKREKNSPSAQKSQLIGFHENLTCVESLMETKSHEVGMVGIWGMGGIGKTTLARAIFDKFKSQFDDKCFLENVRENSTVVGLTFLRKELLLRLKDDKDLNDHKMIEAQDLNDPKMIERLQREKVLIVLDDVNSPKQLKDLLRGLHFGKGSRIIVTSRDKQVLRNGRILEMHIHEVSALNLEKSLELFSRHADQSDTTDIPPSAQLTDNAVPLNSLPHVRPLPASIAQTFPKVINTPHSVSASVLGPSPSLPILPITLLAGPNHSSGETSLSHTAEQLVKDNGSIFMSSCAGLIATKDVPTPPPISQSVLEPPPFNLPPGPINKSSRRHVIVSGSLNLSSSSKASNPAVCSKVSAPSSSANPEPHPSSVPASSPLSLDSSDPQPLLLPDQSACASSLVMTPSASTLESPSANPEPLPSSEPASSLLSLDSSTPQPLLLSDQSACAQPSAPEHWPPPVPSDLKTVKKLARKSGRKPARS